MKNRFYTELKIIMKLFKILIYLLYKICYLKTVNLSWGSFYSLSKIGKYNTEIENRVKKVSNL